MPPLSPFNRTCLALAISQAITLPIEAATITVDDPGDSGINDAVCTLREAIISANTDSNTHEDACIKGSGDDEIVFNSASLTGQTITLGSALPQITTGLTLNGLDQDSLTIDGNGYQVFNISSATVSINSLTIMGGSAGSGGGIYAGYFSSVSLSNNIVSGNTASSGGGIYAGYFSSISLTNSTVSGNSAGSKGGGIEANDTSSFTVTDSTVTGNFAGGNGGGISGFSTSSVSLTNSTVSGNSANTGGGGGIFSFDSSSISLTNSTVSGNSAGKGGGGIYARSSSSVILTNSTVSGNSANTGGGGGIYTNDSGSVSLTNSTVSGNSAGKGGGGIYARISSVSLINSIVSGNLAVLAGDDINDPYINSTITVDHSNLFGDSSNTTTDAFFHFVPGASDINATSDGDGVSIHQPTPLGSILKPLADNGGPTETHALVSNSPAVDAGDTAVCAAGPINKLDQRGEERDEMCDIGSFEFIDNTFCYVINTPTGKVIVFCL